MASQALGTDKGMPFPFPLHSIVVDWWTFAAKGGKECLAQECLIFIFIFVFIFCNLLIIEDLQTAGTQSTASFLAHELQTNVTCREQNETVAPGTY